MAATYNKDSIKLTSPLGEKTFESTKADFEIDSGGSFEIPTVILNISGEQTSGTISEEDLLTIQNNGIIKFSAPNLQTEMILTKTSVQTSGDIYMFSTTIMGMITTLQIIGSTKQFALLELGPFAEGIGISGDKVCIKTADGFMAIKGKCIEKSDLRSFLGDKYTVSVVDGALTIKENY